MPTHIVVEGALGTLNTLDNIATLLGAAAAIQVPADATECDVFLSMGATATNAGVQNTLIRLSGNGLSEGGNKDMSGPAIICTGTPADGDTIIQVPKVQIGFGIPVTPSNPITAQGAPHGVLVGSTECMLEFVFND